MGNYPCILSRYAENGTMAIDNNVDESTIHPIVQGRKNYLFARSLNKGNGIDLCV